MPDFFLDGAEIPIEKLAAAKPAQPSSDAGGVGPIFQKIQAMINPDLLKSVNGVYVFDLKGKLSFLNEVHSFCLIHFRYQGSPIKILANGEFCTLYQCSNFTLRKAVIVYWL